MELAGEVEPFWSTQNFGLGNLNRGKAETHPFSSSGVRHRQQAAALVWPGGWAASWARWSPWTTSCSSWQWPQAPKWEAGYGDGGPGPKCTDSREWASSQRAVCLAAACSRGTDKERAISGHSLGFFFLGYLCFVEVQSLELGGSLFPQTVQQLNKACFPSRLTFCHVPVFATGPPNPNFLPKTLGTEWHFGLNNSMCEVIN